MKSEDRSVFSRMASWLRTGSDQREGETQELARLRAEQLRLSAELEQLLSFYDERTRTLASKLVSSDRTYTDHELRNFVADQQSLWKLIRRLQAAERSVPQLEQEYREWSSRSADHLSECHPDHPTMRKELIASELRVRGRSIPVIESPAVFEGSAKDADPFSDLVLEDDQENQMVPDDSSDDSLLDASRSIPVSEEMKQTLLDQIRECGYQLRKQSVDSECTPQDLAEIYAELRRYHAELRALDRRTGQRRYRVVLHI